MLSYLLKEYSVLGDLAEYLTVGRTRHAKAHRARGSMTRQSNHANIVAEILASVVVAWYYGGIMMLAVGVVVVLLLLAC